MRARSSLLVVALLLAGAGVSAAADGQYAGQTVVQVEVEVAGQPLREPALLDLIETRVGDPLSMVAVRDTIEHFVGLGRFDDIRVEASQAGQGVALRWRLMPVRRIGSVSVSGASAMPDGTIRALLTERFGFEPSTSRVPDMVSAIEGLYADRGYRRPVILPRLVDGPVAERVALALAITAGPRASFGDTIVHGAPLGPKDELVRRLGLAPGHDYDGPALAVRLASYEDELRGLGYYEARVRESHEFSADQRTVTVTLDVEPGPRVRVVFAGDPLPDTERQAMTAIRQERLVDQDLLEDASRNIESALRRQGYRAAQAPYERREEGAELVLTFTVTRGPLHRVGGVDVAGVSALDRSEINPLLQLKPDEPFVEARVTTVAGAIAELYRVRGFSQVTVTPAIQLLPQEARAGVSFRPVDIRFDVVEGPRTMVTAVTIEGAAQMASERLRSLLVLAPGKPFYRPQFNADRDTLERAYRREGYQMSVVTPKLTFSDENQHVAVTWLIEEGPQIQVDHVLIKGNVRTSEALIRREITLHPGSPTSEDALVESQRRLAALGLFRRVRIVELPRVGSSTRDVLVEVEEADSTTISYGGGFEVGRRLRPGQGGAPAEERLELAPRGFFDISRRNLWGKNRSATFFARVTLRPRDPAIDNPDPTDTGGYGFNDYRALFSFHEPRAFNTAGDGQLSAFIEQGVRSSFNFNRKGVSTDYARRLRSFTVTGRYTFDYTQLFDEQIAPGDLLLIDRIFPQVKLSKVFGAVLRDSRDDVLDPQKGAVAGLDVSVAARSLGSQVGFAKTFLQGFIYRRLPGRGYVLAAGARVGLASGFQRIVARPIDGGPSIVLAADLPASERFFAGGDTTVRGFALDRLGTRETLDPQGFPQGGNGLVVFNVETRAPYWKNVQWVGFVDAGNVYRRASDIRLDELRVTSGFGIRYRSPIGPLRIDWGVKVSTRLLLTGGRERSNVVHISLGQAF